MIDPALAVGLEHDRLRALERDDCLPPRAEFDERAEAICLR